MVVSSQSVNFTEPLAHFGRSAGVGGKPRGGQGVDQAAEIGVIEGVVDLPAEFQILSPV